MTVITKILLYTWTQMCSFLIGKDQKLLSYLIFGYYKLTQGFFFLEGTQKLLSKLIFIIQVNSALSISDDIISIMFAVS